ETLYTFWESIDSYNINSQTTNQITFDETEKRTIRIENNYISWISRSEITGESDIYYFNINTNLTTKLASFVSEYDIDGERIVFTNGSWNEPRKLYLYDISSETFTYIEASNPYGMDLDRGYIAWKQNNEIFLYSIPEGTTSQVTNDNEYKQNIILSGEHITWKNHPQSNIYLYDINTQTTTQLTNEDIQWRDVVLESNYLAWVESIKDSNDKVFLYNIEQNETTQIASEEGYLENPDISGEYLAWISDNPGFDNIKLYHPSCNLTQIDTNNLVSKIDLKENFISWISETDVFLYDISLNETTQINQDVGREKYEIATGYENIIWTNNYQTLIIGRPGYDVECDDRSSELIAAAYNNTKIIIYGDHGSPDGWANNLKSGTLEWLPPTFGYSFACSTCNYGDEKTDLFCTNMIRKGSLGYVGAIRTMTGHHFMDEFLNETLFQENTVGKAFQIGKNKELKKDWGTPNLPGSSDDFYGIHDVLIGDPTLKISEATP
ncbi:hypothetical protein KJ708_12755, partial [bacterium]|nr:hypothetical protein [bacterium]